MNSNPATQIDGYKCDHRRQYPDNTQVIFSNLTARSTRRPNTDKVVFAGLQYFLKEFLIRQWNENFFQKPIEEVAANFNRRINNYLGPNQVGDEHIRELHKLGYLPLIIMALPEGTEHPIKVPSAIFWNSDGDKFGWLTNYLETILSTSTWGICTSATTAHQYKKLLMKFAAETTGSTDFVQWQGHDFSFRGMFGMEAACLSGAGHLFSFTGTDTIPAIDFLEQYYNADCEKELIGGSVAATEHSVMCAGGSDNEIGTFRRLINEVYPKGIVSIVSDTWDYWNTITNIARELKPEILAREGKVVFRPDTGDPVRVVVGDFFRDYSDCTSFEVAKDWAMDDVLDEVGKETPHGEYGGSDAEGVFKYKDAYYSIKIYIEWNRHDKQYYYIDGSKIVSCEPVELQPEQKGSIECLWEVFGGKVNAQGYKELDPHVGLIYGDSITLERATAICEGLKKKGFASTNLVFGIGSYTYQYVTRDTDGYAVKATYAKINNQDKEIFKSPKGAEFKKSAKGLVAVVKNDKGEFELKDQQTWDAVLNCEFVKVFENGKLTKDYTLQEVRDNLSKYL
jgi:nicotinamide phosphoribosyltransferase